MSRQRDIGTRAETAVVQFLRQNGWPHAERRALRGARDAGDITGTPGICWEVKGGEAARRASDAQIARWLAETEVERQEAGATHALLVLQRRGVGAPNAGRWWAIMPLADLVALAGTQPLRAPITAMTPARLLLGDAVWLLRINGYGDG